MMRAEKGIRPTLIRTTENYRKNPVKKAQTKLCRQKEVLWTTIATIFYFWTFLPQFFFCVIETVCHEVNGLEFSDRIFLYASFLRFKRSPVTLLALDAILQ